MFYRISTFMFLGSHELEAVKKEVLNLVNLLCVSLEIFFLHFKEKDLLKYLKLFKQVFKNDGLELEAHIVNCSHIITVASLNYLLVALNFSKISCLL